MKVLSFFPLLRLHQWIKNAFIFLPLFFHGQLLNLSILGTCFVSFLSFSFAASAIYCFNDIKDVKKDREHPTKCNRPIASGVVSIRLAYFIMSICLILSFATIILLGNQAKYLVLSIIVCYLVLNIAYTLFLKRLPIVDVLIISIGFVIRIVVGGVTTGIVLSEWIIIMTFLLAMFLAFAKRRDDVLIYETTKMALRKSTYQYNLAFMNQILSVIASVTIIAYIMYTLSADITKQFNSKYVYLTSFFVISGIIRYLQITTVKEKSEDPTQILVRDPFIISCICGWIATFLIILYL